MGRSAVLIMTLVVCLLAVHGLLHLVVWLPRPPVEGGRATFDPSRSVVLTAVGIRADAARAAAVTLAVIATVAYLAAALAVATSSPWWASAATVGALTGLALKLAFFHPWLLVGAALDVGVLVCALADWPSGWP